MKINTWFINPAEDNKGLLVLNINKAELKEGLEIIAKQMEEMPPIVEVAALQLELPDFFNIFQLIPRTPRRES